MFDLLTRMSIFDDTLKDNFRLLDSDWHQLDQVWDGYAYNEFQQSWERVRAMLQEYAAISRRYEEFLRGRIEALEKLDRGGEL